MERRGFLKGMLVGVSAAASEALVKLASPEETSFLAKNRNVVLAQPEVAANPKAPVGPVELYVAMDGQFWPVGRLMSISPRGNVDGLMMVDITTHGDGLRRYGQLDMEVIPEKDGIDSLFKAFHRGW